MNWPTVWNDIVYIVYIDGVRTMVWSSLLNHETVNNNFLKVSAKRIESSNFFSIIYHQSQLRYLAFLSIIYLHFSEIVYNLRIFPLEYYSNKASLR